MYKVILFHLIFWSVDFAMQNYYAFTRYIVYDESVPLQLVMYAIIFFMKVSFFYINLKLLPRVFKLKSPYQIGAFFIGSIAFYTIAITTITQFYKYITFDTTIFGFTQSLTDLFMVITLTILTSTAFFFIHRWNETEHRKRLLANNSFQAKQDVLQKSYEPSFIANSLTDLLNVARDNPKDLAEMVVTLSDVYRYLLGSNSQSTTYEELKAVQKLSSLVKIQDKDCIITLPENNNRESAMPHGLLFIPFAVLCSNCRTTKIKEIEITSKDHSTKQSWDITITTKMPTKSLKSIFQDLGLFDLFQDPQYNLRDHGHNWSVAIEREV